MINKIRYVNPILFLRSQDFRKACGLRGKEKIPSLINDLFIIKWVTRWTSDTRDTFLQISTCHSYFHFDKFMKL